MEKEIERAKHNIIPAKQIPLINKSLIIQVIVITLLIMMIGLILTKRYAETEQEELKGNSNNNLRNDP